MVPMMEDSSYLIDVIGYISSLDSAWWVFGFRGGQVSVPPITRNGKPCEIGWKESQRILKRQYGKDRIGLGERVRAVTGLGRFFSGLWPQKRSQKYFSPAILLPLEYFYGEAAVGTPGTLSGSVITLSRLV